MSTRAPIALLILALTVGLPRIARAQADPELAAGVAALHSGDLDAATTRVGRALESDERTWLVAAIAQARGDLAGAASTWKRLSEGAGPLRFDAAARAGAIWLALGRGSEALRAFELARGAGGGRTPLDAEVGRVEALFALGQTAGALEAADLLRSRFPEAPRGAWIDLLRAEALVALGRASQATAIVEALRLDAPELLADVRGVRLLAALAEANAIPPDDDASRLARARTLRRRRRFDEARALLESLYGLGASHALAGDVAYERARVATATNRWETALECLPRIASGSPRARRIRCDVARGRGEVETWERCLRSRAGADARSVAIGLAGVGGYGRALDVLRAGKKRRLRRPDAEEAIWLWRSGDAKAAAKILGARLARTRGRSNKALFEAARLHYFLGRIAQERGDAEESKRRFDRTVEVDPYGWYRMLARSRLDPRDLDATRATFAWPSPTARCDRPVVESGVPRCPHGPAPFDGPPLTEATGLVAERAATDTHLARARALVRVGEIDEARLVLRTWMLALRGRLDVDPPRLPNAPLTDHRKAQRGLYGERISTAPARAKHKREPGARALWRSAQAWLGALGDAAAARHEADAVIDISLRIGPTERTLDDFRALFPRAYAPAVEMSCAAEGIDPATIWGLMRLESAYDRLAVSTASARGLMQVLPSTAKLVARDLGLKAWSIDRAFEPSTNVALGAHYYGSLVRRFAGQEPIASGAYYIGPEQMAEWTRLRAGEALDVFVETLPDRAVRNYIRKASSYMALYVILYGGGRGLRVGLNIAAPTGDKPDY